MRSHEPGVLLRQFRTRAGLSQEELAGRAGLSVRAISDLERGVRRLPHLDTVRRLADALELNDADTQRLRDSGQGSDLSPRPLGRLPAEVSTLVGRERELLELHSLIANARLVTLTGPGGVGKTRLGLAAAADGANNFDLTAVAWLVTVHDASRVPSTVAEALGVRHTSGRPLATLLAEHVGSRRALLVLDNWEHVPQAAPFVAELLRACAGLHVLATSRQPMRLQGERVYSVSPLTVPETSQSVSVNTALESSAVALFVQRARAASPHFTFEESNAPAIVEICRRLDGLPLAIELAAAHSATLTPEIISSRLDQRLDLLSRPRELEARHRTLRAALDWSHDLLSDEERVLFRRLAVFSGSLSLDAAERVCAWESLQPAAVLELLAELVDKSLVLVQRVPGSTRYHLLEIVREYAAEQLRSSGEEAAIRRRHLEWCADVVGTPPHFRFKGATEVRLLQRLEPDVANMRGALDWSAQQTNQRDIDAGCRLAARLLPFWELRGLLDEGRRWLTQLLERAAEPSTEHIEALVVDAYLAFMQLDLPSSAARSDAALLLAESVGDVLNAASARVQLGAIAVVQNNTKAALEQLNAVLEALDEDPSTHAQCSAGIARFWLGVIATANGDYQRAIALFEAIRDAQRPLGNWLGESYAVAALGATRLMLGDLDAAEPLVHASLELHKRTGEMIGITQCLTLLGWTAALRGDGRQAAHLLGAESALRRRVGSAPAIPPAWFTLAERAERAMRATLSTADLDAALEYGAAAPLDAIVSERQ